MEENEKLKIGINSENDVSQQNGNAEVKPKNKKLTIVLVSVIIVLLIAIGVCVGLWFAGDTTKIINNKEEVVKEEENTSKKLDETKPWVYDADYNKDKEVKTVNNDEGTVWKSSDTLKYPYVNINSKYAEKVNSEIKANFEKNYEHYGISYPEKRINGSYLAEIKYEYYVTDKILSLKINEWFGAVPGGSTPKYYIYNFNLETLEEATLEDVYKECGFNTLNELNDKINITISNEKAEGNLLSDSEWYNNLFYIGKDSVFNIMVNGPVMISNLEIKTNVTKIDNNTESKTENKTDNKVSKSYFEENKNLNYSSNPADSINGKVAILKMGEKVLQTKMCDGYYEYTDNFGNTYYIKQITNITSEYRLRGNNNWAELFRAVIYYVDKDGVNKSFDTAVIVPTNKQDSYIYGPYENYTGTTSFVKSFTNLYAYEEDKNDSTNNLYVKKTLTNEYGDATKTIDVYGRDFIQIVGATGRDNIYYINKDNQLCRTSLVDLNTQILASDVKDIQIDQYDKIHAYPLGNSFLNNIAMEDSNVIYENIN